MYSYLKETTMECTFSPSDCMCKDCRSERHFQRMEDEYERWVNTYWDIPGWDGRAEDQDEVQDLPEELWYCYPAQLPTDEDEDILPF